MTLVLDELTLLCLREGRRDGRDAPRIELQFSEWLQVVDGVLGIGWHSEAFPTRWGYDAWRTANASPLEAIVAMHMAAAGPRRVGDRVA